MSIGFQLCSAARLSWLRARMHAGFWRARALRVSPHVLLCQLLVAGWLLLSAGSASALSLDGALEPGLDTVASEPAPMCDPDAASVAAQDEIPEVDRGRFESLPCEAQLLLSGWQPDVPEVGRRAARCGDVDPPVPAQHADAARPRSEGVEQAGVPFPARSEPLLAEFGARAGLGASCGFEPVPFRPPVTRSR
jgi:hypothetical protein